MGHIRRREGARAPGLPGLGDIDADVPGAVGRVLTDVLGARLTEAAVADTVFADEVAARVARFALGGKRTRPCFLWWAWRAAGAGGGTDPRSVLRVAAALELIQTCALAQDDVQDGSALRRGAPALHEDFAARFPAARDGGREFGRSAAVLAGDLALAWADDTLAETDLGAAARERVRVVWRALRSEMVAGQYLELRAQAAGERELTRATRTAGLKGGMYSVERPLALGAALAGARAEVTRALATAGRSVGLAFQLRDDLLGVFGDPAETGKPVGDDIREGKPTLLVAVAGALARRRGDREALAVLERRVGDPGLTDDGLAAVRAVLEETGARQVVETRIRRLVDHGLHSLDDAPLAPDARTRLAGLMRAVTRPGPPARPVTGPGPEEAACAR